MDDIKPLESHPRISILANDGSLIARYGGIKGNIIAYDQLPPHMVAAVLSIEDRRFYEHFGIDPWGVVRAMWANLRAGHWVQGGSTITQQLAKNLFLTPDKTLRRKVQEAALAFVIEQRFSKEEILATYLNRVYFGSGAYGIDAAARTYFGKPASEVDLWEAAVLAGLLKAPSRFSPASNPELAAERARVVLKAMKEAEYITPRMATKAINEGWIVPNAGNGKNMNRYFTDWVIDQIESFITSNDQDLIIHTTLDPRFQKMAEDSETAFFTDVVKPEDKISQSALVTLSKNGAVLAMIGGLNYGKSQFNRAAQGLRQTGSTFKPFVYLAAIEAGFGPDDKIEDSPLKGNYRPENYEGKYYGEVTLTEALAFSLNTATVRLLAKVGIDHLLDVTKRLGFTRPFKAEFATGLGSGEANLLEMVNAYAMIANGGRAIWPYAVLSIEDGSGNVLYEREPAIAAQLFDESDLKKLDGMLEQVVEQGTGRLAKLSYGHAAGKTGTTQSYRDAWFVGYTDQLVTGIWMGNDNNASMNNVSGGRFPARLWHDYMEQAINVDLSGDVSDNGSFVEGLNKMWQNWSSHGDRAPYNQ